MEINSDFSARAVLRPDDRKWQPSPARGVERQMLDRIGGEIARATTIVRFAPDAEFHAHLHTGGEEYFVLEGTFSDESGDYPAGTYVRNPIGTRHSPHSKGGATLLVKLHQFDERDQAQFAMDTTKAEFQPGLVDGLSVLPLHQTAHESVALVRWAPGTTFSRHRHWGGEEIFVLDGTFQDEHGRYPKGTWLRSPHLSEHTPFSGDGALILVKTGHLHPEVLGPHLARLAKAIAA